MKPWIKKIVVGATVLTASVGLSACTSKKNNKKPYEIDYSFANYEDTYTVNQPFSIVGTVLKITMSDGTTKDIEITESMIKTAPDMSKLGEQTVVIEYEGNKYEFKITVSQHVDEGLVSKLKDFLNKYESNKDSSIDIQIKPNVVAKYLQDSATVDESTSMQLLSTMFDEDMLTDALYNAVFDGVVEGSFNLDRDFIIDSEALKAKLDTVKVLESLKKSGMEFNFKKYAVQKALPDENSDEVQSLISEICNIFEVDSVSGMIAMQEIILNNYNKIRNLEDVDAVIFISEILECAKIYSSNGFIKDTCANIQNLNSENIIHFISTMKKTEWLNNGKVVTKEVFTNWFYNEERPRGISSTEVANLIKKRAYAEENRLAAYENALVALTNVSNVKDVELLVADFLAAHAEYASEMVAIHQGLENKKYTMILDDGNNVEFFGDLTFETVNQKQVCYTDYDSVIEDYSEMAAEFESFAHNIKTYGFLQTIKNKEIVEKIFEVIPNYPEEDKAQAIENIYAILNQELYGDELYWAIADILFPNGDNENYEIIKSIIRTTLEEGLVETIKENQWLEFAFDAVIKDFPEQDKDKVIQDLYAIIEGEKQGEEIYAVMMSILVPNSMRAEQIDEVTDYICNKTSITLQQGKTAMRSVVEKHYLKLLSSGQVDFAAMAQNVVNVVENYTDNEVMRKTITAMKSESVAQALETLEVVEQLFNTYLTQYPEASKQQAIDLIYSIIKGEKQGEDLHTALFDILLPQETKDNLVQQATEKICSISSIYSEQGENAVKDVVNKYFEQLIKLQGIDVRTALEEIGKVINEYTDYELVKQVTENLNSQDINELIHLLSDIYRVTKAEDYFVVDKNDINEESYTIIETEETKKIIEDYINLKAGLIESYENELFNLNDIASINDILALAKRCVNHVVDYHNNSISYWESQRGADLIIVFYDYDSYCIEPVCLMYYDTNNHSYEIDADDTIKFRHNSETIEKLEQYVDCIDILSDLCEGSYESLSDLLDENKDKWIGSLLDKVNYPEEVKQQAIDTIVSVIKGEKKGEDLYLAITNVLTPKEDDYYIDYATNMICWLATIDSSDGETEIRNIISTYYNKLITAEQFDVKVALEELSDALYTYSSNDYVKQAISDLNTQDINEVIHLISNLAEMQLSTCFVVVDSDNCYKSDYTTIDTPEAKQFLADWSKLTVDMIVNIENEILSLTESSSVNDMLTISKNVGNHLIAYYESEIEFWTANAETEFIIAKQTDGRAIPIEMFDYWNGERYAVDLEYSVEYWNSEIEFYQSVVDYIDLASRLYNDTYQTWLDILDNEYYTQWIRSLLDDMNYPHQDKDVAVEKIISILKGEKQDKDLYLALVEILVPSTNKESHIDSITDYICNKTFIESTQGCIAVRDLVDIYYSKLLQAEEIDISAFAQDMKNIIAQHTSDEAIVNLIDLMESESVEQALRTLEAVEQLFDRFLPEYPEDKKQQAINTIYSIINGEKKGKDLYLAISEIVAPDKGEAYVENISNFLSTLGVVESSQGQKEIKQIVKANVDKLLAAESVDANELVIDLVEIFEEHSSSEYIKVYAKNIKSNDLKHFLSDMLYADYKHHHTVIKLGANGSYNNQPTTNDVEAQMLLNRHLNNIKTALYNCENVIFNLSSVEDFVDVLDGAHTVMDSISKFYAEEISILEDLRQTNYMIMEKEYIGEIPGYVVYEDDAYLIDFFPYIRHSHNYRGSVETVDYYYDETIEGFEYDKAIYDNMLQLVDGVRLIVTDPQTMIEDLIAEYKEEAVGTILNMCYEMLEIDPSSDFAQEVTNFAVDCVDSYIAGNFNKQEALKTIDNIIETYASPETKTVLKASFMLYNAINYDEEIDYNEIFKDIALPEEIKDVDFNVLIKKILDSNTYDIFTFSDVEIEYITNDNDEIVAEKLTLKVDVDFDVMISSMKGDVEITMILDLDGQI